MSNSLDGGDFGYQIEPESSQVETQVRTISGDELVQNGNIPSPTVIKMDVEGAELDVVRGLSETLGNDLCRLVYCELHNGIRDAKRIQEEVKQELRNHGFEVKQIYTRNDQPFIRGQKPRDPKQAPSETAFS